jgi:hypothetical protein
MISFDSHMLPSAHDASDDFRRLRCCHSDYAAATCQPVAADTFADSAIIIFQLYDIVSVDDTAFRSSRRADMIYATYAGAICLRRPDFCYAMKIALPDIRRFAFQR